MPMKPARPAILKQTLVLTACLLCLYAPALRAQTTPPTPPGRIVYYQHGVIGDDGTDHYQIFSISPNGGGRAQLTHAAADCLLPDLSPDGTKIAFTSDLDGGGLHVMNSDGTGIAVVPGLTAYANVSWSPDGTKFALVGGDIGAVATANVDGTGLRDLTARFVPNVTSTPKWSPDGTKLVVEGYTYINGSTPSTDQLFIVPTDGSTGAVQFSTDTTANYRDPDWSPDGTKIVCTKSTGGGGIYTLDAATAAETLVDPQLSDGTGGGSNPVFSPDGTQIAFWDTGTTQQIGIINLDGTGRHVLPTGQGINPRWSKAGGLSGDTITIPGVANVYNAGLDVLDATVTGGAGAYPVQLDVTGQAGKAVTFPGVTGGAFFEIDNQDNGDGPSVPDGDPNSLPEYLATLNGLSGYATSHGAALIGVFLGNGNLVGMNPPASLDFTADGLGTDFVTLAPAIGQVFFIGDGLTSGGAVQQFNVPDGAQTLYLGIADGGNGGTDPQTAAGFNDNGGAYYASFAYVDAAAPGAPVITSPLAVNGTRGHFFSYQIAATNTPTSFAASGLPDGLGFDPAYGIVTGVPTVSGTFSVTISATNAVGTTNATLVITLGVPGSNGTADLVLTPQAATNSATVGGQITYAFTLTNNGPDTATGIQGAFVKPDAETLITDASTPDITADGNTLYFPLPDLASGTTENFTLVLSADAAGTFTVVAGATAFQTDPTITDANTSTTTTIAPGDGSTPTPPPGGTTQPTVAITSPPNNITVAVGVPVTLTASVTDPSTLLDKVQFLVNGIVVATKHGTGPYTATAAAPFAGVYVISVVATDTQGRSNTDSVTVTAFQPDSTSPPPTSTLLTPLDGLDLAAGSKVTLSVSADSATAGGLDHVDINVDGVTIASFDASGNLLSSTGQHAGGPAVHRADAGTTPFDKLFSTSFQLPAVDKIVSLIVAATDKLGHTSVSSAASVHAKVTTDRAPVVAFSNLGASVKVPVGSSNTANVTASDPDASVSGNAAPARLDAGGDGTLSKVDFFLNGANAGEATQAPFSFPFSPAAAGKYVLSAVATDGSGLSTVSDPVVVEADAGTPTVTVVAAGDGLAVEGGENGKVAVRRDGGNTSAPLVVHYKVTGSARAGTDYKMVTGTVTIPAGAVQAKVKLKPINDQTHEGTRVAKVKLLPATDGSYNLGETTVAKVRIIDND